MIFIEIDSEIPAHLNVCIIKHIINIFIITFMNTESCKVVDIFFLTSVCVAFAGVSFNC